MRDRSLFLAALPWLGLYLALILVPLLALLAGDAPGRGFAWDFAMALGYAVLAMLGAQFGLTARFKHATAPLGIDLVYYLHRYLAVIAVGFACVHVAIVAVAHPDALGSANPLEAPMHMSAGRAAILLFAVIIALSLGRKQLGLDYETWRMSHAVLGVSAYSLALWHVFGSGEYLDTTWKQAGWAAFGAFWLAVAGYVRLVRPARVARSSWRVAQVRPERGRVWTLMLEPREDGSFAFRPGQFVWLSLRASPFAMREHPFSIASSAARPRQLELSIKELGDFTSTIRHVLPGETAWLDGPYGTFGIDERPHAPGYVFVAGGIGIAPVISMLRTLADRGDSRPLVLFYGNRVWERVAFREELDALRRQLTLTVVHVLLDPPEGWAGERGYIAREVLERHLPEDRSGFEYFACGPVPMTRSVEASLGSLGVPASRIHSEIFEWV